MPSQLEPITISFTVTVNGEQRAFTLDLWQAKTMCEHLEARHALPIIDGCYKPTIEFLKDLQLNLQDIGAPSLTPSAAVQVWVRINSEFTVYVEQLKQANTQTAKPGFVKQLAAKLFGGLNRKERRKLAARVK